MRRHVVTTTLALLLAGTALTLGPPAGAEPAERGAASPSTAARKGGCYVGVLGVDSQRRVRYELFKDGVLDRSQVAAEPLPFDVTAWGYYDSKGRGKRTLQLNAVTADGTPRNLTIKQTKTSLSVGKVQQYDQGTFRPRLFADGYTYYAYTVQGGTLQRSTLTRFTNGDRKFYRPVDVAKGFGDWTSLQTATFQKVRGVTSEILYGTTRKGELMQVVVPADHPGRAKVRRLATSGYAGVSELSWGACGKKLGTHVLVAVSPGTGSATWTTIKRPDSKPKAKLRGPLAGVADWSFTATY